MTVVLTGRVDDDLGSWVRGEAKRRGVPVQALIVDGLRLLRGDVIDVPDAPAVKERPRAVQRQAVPGVSTARLLGLRQQALNEAKARAK